MSRIHRLLRLITLLQSDRPRTVDALVEELGVSRRTLFRDLNMLQAAGIPYYHEPGMGYRIARTFFLPPISLTVPETLGLMLLGKTAGARRGQPLFVPALSAIYKLIATVPEPIRTACGDLMQNVTFDPGIRGAGDAETAYFATLQQCVDEGRSCQMIYKSPVEPETLDCRLDPYALHFASRAWYVLGKTDRHSEVRLFKVARIQSLGPLARRFVRPKRFTVADKLGQAWQLIPEGTVHRVELEFTPKVATNVSEVLWHRSQKHTILPDGRCRMTFDVDGLGEIAWWVCGYADQVKIVRPAALRRRVRQMLTAALEHA
ncbi:MAG: YafY family protein [Phycisphaeraceae bacterium]